MSSTRINALNGITVHYSTLQRACDLITKLANRSFLKLFLRCDELNGAITQVNEELEDCVRIFQVSCLP